MRRCIVFGCVVQICVCVSVWAELLKLLSYKLYFRCAGTSLEYLCHIRVSRSSDQGQGHTSKNASHTSVTKYKFAGGLPSTERQSCT